MASSFVLVKDLNPKIWRRSIRLRLIRTFLLKGFGSLEKVQNRECLFHDQECTFVHVQIPHEYVDKFNKILKEGQVYEFEDFVVQSNRQSFKTCDHTFINSSYLWRNCNVLRLTKNLRLQSMGSMEDKAAVEWYSRWIAEIGDGIAGGINSGIAQIDIPEQFLLNPGPDPIATIVESIFPSVRTGVLDPADLEGRAILSPTLDVVDQVNQYMIDLNPAEGKTYLSADSYCQSDQGADSLADIHTVEYLNGIRTSGVPNHSLILKVGAPVMLIRNIDHSLGLCNGTRLIVTKTVDHVIQARIVNGTNAGTKVLMPRMSLTPSDPRLPFKFQRRQFSLMLAYAMTINKSQGQTLSHVGLLLKKPVFNHGQLYVAFSKVTHSNGLKILALDDDGRRCSTTSNVVYMEVFNNL